MIETTLFDGRDYAEKKLNNLAERVKKLREKGIEIKMASIFLTSDRGSVLYTNIKKKSAEMIGVSFQDYGMGEKDTGKIISIIKRLNEDESCQGILVQKPSGVNDFEDREWAKIVSEVSVNKDIDGLNPINLGLLMMNTPRFIPATVRAVLEIIKESGFNPAGKRVVIVGSSEILGRPLAMEMVNQEATVAMPHKRSGELRLDTVSADLLVTATGSPGIIGEEDIKEGVVIIDVSSPKGDVRKEKIMGKAAFYTPVPGGVGPVTVTCLLENLVESVERNLVQ